VIVVVVLLFLTVPLSYMPNAVLAAVVFLIGLKLIDVAGMRSVYRLRPGEFAVALITAATVVIVGVEQGIILAIVLSVIVVLAHVYKPHDRIISFKGDGSPVFGSVTAPVEAAPGLVIYAFGAELFYANASRFTEEIVAILESARTPIKWFAIDAAAMGDVDYSGADAMRQINKAVTEHGAKLVMSNVDTPVRQLLDAYGITDLIGASAIFPDASSVLAAYSATDGGAGALATAPAPA
jgi:MFS superfamily sulfate permease-like transporter